MYTPSIPSATVPSATLSGIGDSVTQKMRAGWLPAGVHTWRAADGKALFHRLRFVRPLRRDPASGLNECSLTLHFDGKH
jgi:hypothetical protein